MAGDRLDLYRHRLQLLAIAQPDPVHPVRLSARQAPRRRWQHFRSDTELRDSVQKLYPGFPYQGFEVLARGVSGRVGLLRLEGRGGETLLVEGLAVRWTLDLPETLFNARRQEPRGKPAGWLFTGSGWGHGVGMCQSGAFAMAVRGLSYREILEHYFTGIELGRVRLRRERSRGGSEPDAMPESPSSIP